MRKYILSEAEREIMTRFLEDGTRLAGYYQLRHRLRANQPSLQRDVVLMTKFEQKLTVDKPEIHRYLEELLDVFEKIDEWFKKKLISEKNAHAKIDQ